MKKIILVFALLFATLSLGVQAENYNLALKQGIRKYKAGNYLNCIQRMDNIVKNDPSNALAHYYLAISNARIGNKDVAIAEYRLVKAIDSSFLLSLYADKGIKCIESPSSCDVGHLDSLGAEDQQEVVQDSATSKEIEKQQKLRKIKTLLNEGEDIPKEDMQMFKDLTPKKKSNLDVPSDTEIANAIKVLAKVGMNPMSMNMGMGGYPMDSKNMQMQMLMSSLNPSGNNNNSYNSMNSMMPFMMMQQGGEKANPELMQSMMTNMLMPDLSSFGNTSNN